MDHEYRSWNVCIIRGYWQTFLYKSWKHGSPRQVDTPEVGERGLGCCQGIKSFKVGGITVAMDGSEDNEYHCLKKEEVKTEDAPQISELTSKLESQEDSFASFSDLNDNDDKELGTEELLVMRWTGKLCFLLCSGPSLLFYSVQHV